MCHVYKIKKKLYKVVCNFIPNVVTDIRSYSANDATLFIFKIAIFRNLKSFSPAAVAALNVKDLL